MSWNYRVMRTTDPNGTHDYAIHAVYYGDDGAITSWTERSVGVAGATFKELTQDFANYQHAFGQHVLDVRPDGLYNIGGMGNARDPKLVLELPQADPAVGEDVESGRN